MRGARIVGYHLSDIRAMKAKKGSISQEKVRHPGYEGQNGIEGPGKKSDIWGMKAKTGSISQEKVRHPRYEDPNGVDSPKKRQPITGRPRRELYAPSNNSKTFGCNVLPSSSKYPSLDEISRSTVSDSTPISSRSSRVSNKSMSVSCS
jgi:hypothetical protein